MTKLMLNSLADNKKINSRRGWLAAPVMLAGLATLGVGVQVHADTTQPQATSAVTAQSNEVQNANIQDVSDQNVVTSWQTDSAVSDPFNVSYDQESAETFNTLSSTSEPASAAQVGSSSGGNPNGNGSNGNGSNGNGSSGGGSGFNWPSAIQAQTTGHPDTRLAYGKPNYRVEPSFPGASQHAWEATDMRARGKGLPSSSRVFCDNASWQGPNSGKPTKYGHPKPVQPGSVQYKVLQYIYDNHIKGGLAEVLNWAADGNDGGIQNVRSGTISRAKIVKAYNAAMKDTNQTIQACTYFADSDQAVGGVRGHIQRLTIMVGHTKGQGQTNGTGHKGSGKGGCGGGQAAGAAGGGAGGAASGPAAAGGASTAGGAAGATNGTAGGTAAGGNGNNDANTDGPNNNVIVPNGPTTDDNNTPTNNNIVPQTPVINNNDHGYYGPIDDHVGPLTALAALITKENTDMNAQLADLKDKDMNGGLDRGQSQDNWMTNIEKDIARRNGSLAAEVKNDEQAATNNSEMQSYAASAEMQSLQNSLADSAQLASLKQSLAANGSNQNASQNTNDPVDQFTDFLHGLNGNGNRILSGFQNQLNQIVNGRSTQHRNRQANNNGQDILKQFDNSLDSIFR